MARFSRGLLQSLANPSYGQNLFTLGQQAGSAEAMGRERERQSNRLERAMDITGKGIASAQAGDTSALSAQMGQLRELIKDPNMPIEEKQLYIQELRALQGMMPRARQTATSNSATALMRIDDELQDEVALRKKINDGYAKRGMAPITDAAFKSVTDSLKTQQKRLLENPNVGAEYKSLRIEKNRQDAELQVLEASEWLNQNGPGIREAIKSGNQDVLDGLLKNVPPQYDREVQTFISAEISNQERLEALRENSIAKNKAPVNVDFQDEIDRIKEAGFDVEGLSAANAKYKEFLKENWNGKTWTSAAAKVDAARMEENILRIIEDRDSLAVETDFRSARARAAQDDAIIKEAEINVRTFRPSDSNVRSRANALASERDLVRPGEDIGDLDGPERARLLRDAEEQLIEENTRTQARVIRDIDVSRTPEGVMRPVTKDQAVLVSRFTEEDQKEILREYARSNGMDSIDEIIEDLQDFGDIGEPSPEKTPDDRPASSRRGGANEIFRFTLPEKTANILRGFGVGVSDSDED